MPEDTATLPNGGQDILSMLAEHRQKLEADLGGRFVPLTDFEDRVKAAIASAQNGETAAEITAKVQRVGEAYDQLSAAIPELRNQMAELAMRQSDDMPRLHKAGSPWNGLAIDEIQAQKIKLLGVRGPERDRLMKELDDTINASNIDKGTVEAYFGLLEKRLPNGLDCTMETARDLALGRMTGRIVSGGTEASNWLYTGINASLTTEATSGGATIPSIWDTSLWVQMNAVGDNFVPQIEQVPMTSETLRLLMWGDEVWDTPQAQAELGNRNDPAITAHSLIMTARDLEARVFISQNILDDSAAAIEMEFRNTMPVAMMRGMHKAIILGDDNDNAGQNVNGVAQAAPSPGNPRIPEFLGWKGLFAYSLAEAASQRNLNGAFTSDNVDEQMDLLRNQLGWGGKDNSNVFYLTTLTERQAFRRYSDTFRTLDNVGAMASALTGDVNRMYGVEIYTPRVFPAGMLPAGRLSTNQAQNTTGAILAVAKDHIRIGMRRMPSVIVYPTANLSPEGIYPGIKMRFGFGMKGRNPENGQIIPDILLKNERGVAMLRNITRA